VNASWAHRRAEADVVRLRDAVIDAHAEAHEGKARKASAERDEAERTTLRDASERLEGAVRAVAKAEAEHGLFAVEHCAALLEELTPGAVAVARAVDEALQELVRSHAELTAFEADVAALLRNAGRDARDLPRFPEQLARLMRDARRAAGVDVPPPVPGGQAVVPITPPAEAPANLPTPDRAHRPSRRTEAA
jgi:hypothetical protein